MRLGAEFQVNAHTTSYQGRAAAAIEDTGEFVVVWNSGGGQDGELAGIFGQRFSAAGARLGSEFRINTYTVGSQSRPAVGVDGDGDFVVVWTSAAQDGASSGIFGQRFDSSGVRQGGEFQVNTYTTGGQRYAQVASSAGGAFVVVWDSPQDGSYSAVFARRFDSAGGALALEFQVNSFTEDHQLYPAIAMRPDGSFIVAWQSQYQDGSYAAGIFAQRFNSLGAKEGIELQVNAYVTDNQDLAKVAMDDDGDFVVVWRSNTQDGGLYGTFGRRFLSTGAAQGVEFQINSRTLSNQVRPAVAIDAKGNFAVVWQSLNQDGGSTGVFGQDFSSSGASLGGEFLVNSFTTDAQSYPAIAMTGSGNFVVAWQSEAQDGNAFGVFAQRYGHMVLDLDGDASSTALTDGLLALRYLFGFTGATLTSGAVTGSCTRCTPGEIEAYLAAIEALLDVDGNGSPQALTDGLLILRYLFGFTGAALTSGAVDTGGCMRCDAGAIIPYIAGLVG